MLLLAEISDKMPTAAGAPIGLACGYNLTGNASGRCPEYGVAVSLARSCDAERSWLACTDE